MTDEQKALKNIRDAVEWYIEDRKVYWSIDKDREAEFKLLLMDMTYIEHVVNRFTKTLD